MMPEIVGGYVEDDRNEASLPRCVELLDRMTVVFLLRESLDHACRPQRPSAWARLYSTHSM